jgi:ATP-dependent DNA helicase RecQ
MLDASDREIFELLRVWRAETARAASVPAFVVFPDTTLTGIAQARPSTHDELMAVSGIGVKKLEQFGDDVLAVVASAARSEPARADVDPGPSRGRRFYEGELPA